MHDNFNGIFGIEPVASPEKPIETKPEMITPSAGIYKNIPASVYFSWPAINSSFIKAYSVNPYAAKFCPFRGSAFTDLGGGSHAYSLEGAEAFDKEYFVMPDIPCPEGNNPKGWKNTNDYRELVAEYDSQVNGRVVLNQEQWEAIKGIDASLRAHPMAKRMLNRGCNELSIVWVDPGTGMTCKARLDDYYDGVPSDLKTASDILWFQSDIYKRKYHLQGAHYTSGLLANDLPVDYFVFIAAQTTETYPIRTGYIQPGKLADAQLEVDRLLGLIKQSFERDFWPNLRPPTLLSDGIHPFESWDQLTAENTLEEW